MGQRRPSDAEKQEQLKTEASTAVQKQKSTNIHHKVTVRAKTLLVPGLAFDIISFNRMQEKHKIILKGAGASMLGGGGARFKTFRAGNLFEQPASHTMMPALILPRW